MSAGPRLLEVDVNGRSTTSEVGNHGHDDHGFMRMGVHRGHAGRAAVVQLTMTGAGNLRGVGSGTPPRLLQCQIFLRGAEKFC